MQSFTKSLGFVAANGNLTQIYSPGNTAGTGVISQGNTVRAPTEGLLYQMELQTDGINGGVIQLYDIDGSVNGADVNTSDQITNAQLTAALAATPQRAVLIYTQEFAGSGTARLAITAGTRIAHGVAARFVAAAGSCILNFQWSACEKKTSITG